MKMKETLRRLCAVLCLFLLLCPASPVRAASKKAKAEEETRLEPAWPVPDYVEHLLEVASEEVGYQEDHGRTKYGEWAGDPAAQWCAEFQCWCVDQVDKRWGTELLRNVYPFYTSSNTGLRWFLKAGRYVVRKGKVEGWGYMWLKGSDTVIQSGDYIPQPGDWVFFNWTGGTDTEHVALVEYCTRNPATGNVTIHVIEGNLPSAVARNTYNINDSSIMGYGTVRDVADITLTFGNEGEKVVTLQEQLAYLGFMDPTLVTGHFGDGTMEAVRAYQQSRKLRVTGIANMKTQKMLAEEFNKQYTKDPDVWSVVDDDD